ncbi:MAG TPA: DUF1553 domain-containing protein, partial [Planctomycetota bacterium]
ARVTVNHFWQQVFGTGIVKTSEDFGSQGEWPSHPDLLDWLAVEFVANGWDVKDVFRTMVTSATYRQDSTITPELFARDPENRLLAHGPRFRLEAEAIRDQALFVSGLLVEKLGGKSVKPYQPDGLWREVAYGSATNARSFLKDEGEGLWRRSLYTFIKRTAPPPGLTVFDAPNRENCVVRRQRTNTPLQALALMNDEQYVEASRVLAERTMREGGATADERAFWAFRQVTTRTPSADELGVLLGLYHEQFHAFLDDDAAARALIEIGDAPTDAGLDPTELAAWTLIGNLLLNLDEVLVKS